MDPLLFPQPGIILNDRKEPDCSQFPADRSASQGELDIPKLSEPSLQTSHEIISQVGQSPPSRPRRVMNESALPGTSTVAEMVRSIANSDKRMHTESWTQSDSSLQSVQHLIQSLTGPIEPQIQAQDSPSLLRVQTSSPGARSQPVLTPLLPDLIFTSSSPQDSCWLDISPVASKPNSRFGLSPYALAPISSPTEFWYSPYSPPHSWLLLPVFHPCQCMCLQTVPVHQPCSPDLLSRNAAPQVSQQLNVSSAASGKEENEERAKSEEEQQKTCTPDKDKLHANNTGDKTTKSKVSPGCLPSLDEESLAERSFEEYMTIMDSLSPKIHEGVEAKENENEVENGSFLEYLDELCSDEDFITKVESILNIEFLDSLLPSDAEAIDLLAFEKHEQEMSQKLHEGPLPGDPPTSESPSTSTVAGSSEDPPTIAVKDAAASFRADLLTVSPPESAGPPALRVLAQKTLPRPQPPAPGQTREPEEQYSPTNINPKSTCLEDYTIPVPANSSFVADSHVLSCDAPSNPSVSVPDKQPKGLQVSQELASSAVSSELWAGERGEIETKCEKNQGKDVGTTVTQKQTALTAKEEGRTKKTFERKEDKKENETKVRGMTNTKRSQRLSGQTEKVNARLSGEFITERVEERKPSEKNIKKTAKLTPERDGVIFKKQSRWCSGGRQLSKTEGRSQATKKENTADQFSKTGEKEHRKLEGEMQKIKLEGGEQCEAKNPNVGSETGVENALSTKMEQEEKELHEGRVKKEKGGIQISSLVRRRTRSTMTEEQLQPNPLPGAGARGKIKHPETERSERKTLPVSSPVTRRRRGGGGEESRERDNDAYSTGCKTNEDKVSGNCSPVSLTESPLQSPGVQTDIHSARASVKESPGEGPLDERPGSPSVKTCEKNLNLTPALCSENQQRCKTLSGGGADRHVERGETGHRGVDTGTETWDFYSLRSQTNMPNVSIRAVNRIWIQEGAPNHPSNLKPSPHQTADMKGEDGRINGEEAERRSLSLSPMKRNRHERGASEEREKRANETVEATDTARTKTEMVSSSPVKRRKKKV